MQLFFNNNPLHVLGALFIVGESSTAQPPENPTEYAVKMTVRISAMSDTPDYHNNRGRIDAARDWLSPAIGTLRLVNDAVTGGSGTYIERPVTVISHDLPENPNSPGVYRQDITIVFGWAEPITESSDAMTISFQRPAGSLNTLGSVSKWREQFQSSRLADHLSERKSTIGKITASGKFKGGATQTIAQRRVDLFALKERWITELMIGKEGTLKYGTAFNESTGRLVRIDEFTAEVDQAIESIEWSLSATFTLFPNESTYAIAEYDSKISKDYETGEETLSLNGRVVAASKVIATAKLDSIRTAVISSESFSTGTQIKSESSCKYVSVGPASGNVLSTAASIDDTVNADNGPSSFPFVELSFNEEYRRKLGTCDSWTVKCTSSEDITSGMTLITYSGTVVASGSTYSAAYEAAKSRADSLGRTNSNAPMSATTPRYQFLTKAEYDTDYRHPQGSGATIECVSLRFSFSYKIRGSKIYYEVQCSRSKDYHGETVDSVRGSITAPTKSEAETLYSSHILGSGFDWHGLGLRNETTSYDLAGISETEGVAITTGETTKGAYKNQHVKFDFSFNVVIPRDANEKTTMRYEIEVNNNYVDCIETRISGVINAASKETATNKIDTMLSAWIASYGQVKSRTETSSVEELIMAGHPESEPVEVNGPSFPFSLTFSKPLTDDDKILETDLTEDITYPGKRWVFQPIPYGTSVPQDCGITDGTRTIRGTVKALTEVAADNWMRRTVSLPLFGYTPTASYKQPPQIATQWVYNPKVFGDEYSSEIFTRGTLSKFCVKSFTFTEAFLGDALTLWS